MKKHIIIAGVPRSGKSTISQRISKNLGYQHISMDSIIAGIEKVFPETGIDSDADTDLQKNIQYISSKMALFIRAMMDSGEYNECDYGMVIDIFQLLPQHYIQYMDSSVCDIYYFGTSEVTPEERYAILKKYDTPRDYTYYKSEEENKKNCADIVTISKWLKDECRIYNLPYYDTSFDREHMFGFILNLLCSENGNFKELNGQYCQTGFQLTATPSISSQMEVSIQVLQACTVCFIIRFEII